MFGFSSIVSRRRTKESLEEKIFKKKRARRGSRREKRRTGEQTSLQRSRLLILGSLTGKYRLSAADYMIHDETIYYC